MNKSGKGKRIAVNIAGTLIIPVVFLVVLEIICLSGGKQMISNLTSFNNFDLYGHRYDHNAGAFSESEFRKI